MGVGGTRIVSFRQPNYYPVTQQKGASQTGVVAQPYSSYCGLLMRWAVVEIRRRGKGKGKGRKRKRERERERAHEIQDTAEELSLFYTVLPCKALLKREQEKQL